MELKKSKTANLESKRPTLLLVGLIFAFGITLESFEWLKSDVRIQPISALGDEDLFEPISEVMVVKPAPKSSSSANRQRMAKKGPVVVTPEPTPPITPKPNPKPDPNPNPNPKTGFDIDNELPDFEGDDKDIVLVDPTLPFAAVEEKPEFIGGPQAMMKFISKNVHYPSICRDNGVQGRVFISFIIDEDGNVTNVELEKGKNKHLDKEAIRVIKKMPKWKPGKQRGKTVKVKYTIPVNYKLRN